ncbi:metal ABC transporter substrate-binding protein [Halorubrum sp. CBA1229]|uniref:metal ABC transporter substrate-binding protein n=1 Tax=Halorubrum sp. CBA1229 TaxID=1853699 RepID=UPI000F3CB24C|nr:metal ABC transporter substrate-binding protein [Halorubrum sp. CBA1229]QKY15344.1 metal ABC transporter substrate-binding protein [Halorubrum sp. CBA1229]
MSNDTNEAAVLSRRRFAGIGAGVLAGGLAGCTGNAAEPGGSDGANSAGSDTGTDDGEYTVVASFFTFYDFADTLAEGTALNVENLVPTGLHGHGWEPDPSIQRRITDADALVHVGPDFQPWVDRAIDTLEAETTETALINARAGVELLDLADSLTEDEAVEDAKDPHFWLDPQRAKVAVANIADGLASVAPDDEATIRENADAIDAELDALDEEWTAVFDAAERDVAFLAAHNAFQYVSERYGATIEPLVVNLAASNDVRPADMQRAQDTIAANDIRHIGAAVFEPIRPARQLLEQTDVEAYFPVTPYAGTAESWVERGWGYFEIAREVNLPTFRILLGVEDLEDVTFADYGRNFEP